MKKIYVVSICKNELKNVKRFIENTIQADKVIVLDTGSTDGTYEALCDYQKEYKNLEIYQKNYNEFRFDIARNDALSYIDSKERNNIVVVNLDFDEYFYQKDWKNILQNFVDKEKRKEFFIDCLYKDNSDITIGTNNRIITCMRMFCGENFTYQNEVHETIAYNDSAWLDGDLYSCCNQIIIVHDQDSTKSRENYINLGEDELEQKTKKNSSDDFVKGQIELLLIFEYNRNNNGKKSSEHNKNNNGKKSSRNNKNNNGKKSSDDRLKELYEDVKKLPVDRSFANVWMYEHYKDKKYINDLLDIVSGDYYDQNVIYLLLKEIGRDNIPKEKLDMISDMFEWYKNFIGEDAFKMSEMDQEIEKLLYPENTK